MKKNLFFILCLIIFLIPNVNAGITDVQASIEDSNSKIIYRHQLRQNQTVYGLSKFLHVDVNSIKSLNKGIDFNSIKLDQTIVIPIEKSEIITSKNELKQKAYIPVFYTVKPKDNLFRIAKVYFNQSIENIIALNHLRGMDLVVGQELIVGWYPYENSFKDKLEWSYKGLFVDIEGQSGYYKYTDQARKKFMTDPTTSTIDLSTSPNKTDATTTTSDRKYEDFDFYQTSEPPIEIRHLSQDPFELKNGMYAGPYLNKPATYERKVSALWNDESPDKINLFALHSSAKVDSYIEIYNPMLNRKVIAKVIGNIPENTYKRDVELIVSPKVAETLGAVDKKFLVRIRYIKD